VNPLTQTKERHAEYMRDYRARQKEPLINLFMGDVETVRLLKEVEALSKGSPEEQRAVELYVEVALRNCWTPNTLNFEAVKKATREIQDVLPENKRKAILETSTALVNRMNGVMTSFMDKLFAMMLAKAELLIETRLGDTSIDGMVERKIASMPLPFQTQLRADVAKRFPESPLTASQFARFLARMKKEKD
jgi:hypothetical protein